MGRSLRPERTSLHDACGGRLDVRGDHGFRVARRMRPAINIVPTAAAPPANAMPMYPSVRSKRSKRLKDSRFDVQSSGVEVQGSEFKVQSLSVREDH